MEKPTVAIAGATGFIGRWFIAHYANKYRIIALSRRNMDPALRQDVTWRKVDLYSLSSTVEALNGADYALYLVHSMQPSTRLNQSSFEDTDLLLADNFARAAEMVGLRQIIFLGGILPKESEKFSRHLRSRYEVEQTLGSRKAALTALRAGIVVGPGGSSFQIIEKLVRRLPAMLCPKWTLSKTQPIGYSDVLKITDYAIGNTVAFDQSIEIGGGQPLTYMEMLQITARLMGKNRLIKSVPFFSLGLSKLWVAVFSDSSTTFVSPLIESLRHTMTVTPHPLVKKMRLNYEPFEGVVKRTLQHDQELPALPEGKPDPKVKNTVRSVQRLPLPEGKDAIWVANAYTDWLPRAFISLISVHRKGERVYFRMLGIKLLILQFAHDRSDSTRQLFYIVGGVLARRTDYGWLEFRTVLGGQYVIAAIHEFVPKLPWFIYINTQALVHLWVMKRFGKFLSKA